LTREISIIDNDGVKVHTVFYLAGGTMRDTRLMKAEEVAAVLGVSRSKVYRMMRERDIPTITFGKNVRVSCEDLEKFLTTNRSSNGE
jgi:excisionase family DNA binding protein